MTDFRLKELRFVPRGDDGLSLPTARFGAFLTWICGPNGSGKTPLMRGLASCFGYPAAVAPEIQERVEAVTLAIESDGERHELTRLCAENFELSATTDGSETTTWTTEREASGWILKALGIASRTLEKTGGGEVPPYISIVMPTFSVDQDLGWSLLYAARQQFAKNQEEEVRRWMLGVSARNAIGKEESTAAAATVKQLQKAVDECKITLTTVKQLTTPSDTRNADRLATRCDELRDRLADDSAGYSSMQSALSTFDSDLVVAEQEILDAERRHTALQRQLARIRNAVDNVEAETAVLRSNEVAASAFRSLCGSTHCHFFREPEVTYGRKLLYLKDQLKDLAVSSGALEQEATEVHKELNRKKHAIAELRASKERSASAQGFGALAESIRHSASELVDLELRLGRAQRALEVSKDLSELTEQLQRAKEHEKALRPSSQSRADTRALDCRKILADRMSEWLEALSTPNIRGPVSFDERFGLFIGDQKFPASYSGSTRTRIVLAYHASLLETSWDVGGQHPSIMLLDAPKQHELNTQDLTAFIETLRSKATKRQKQLQVVVTSTEETQVDETTDQIWRPEFTHEDKLHFLGRRDDHDA